MLYDWVCLPTPISQSSITWHRLCCYVWGLIGFICYYFQGTNSTLGGNILIWMRKRKRKEKSECIANSQVECNNIGSEKNWIYHFNKFCTILLYALKRLWFAEISLFGSWLDENFPGDIIIFDITRNIGYFTHKAICFSGIRLVNSTLTWNYSTQVCLIYQSGPVTKIH